MRSLTVPAPAKLNLFLHVTGRRSDGRHLLETFFVALDFGDTVRVARREDGAIRRVAGWQDIPEEHDLAMRAARALQSASGSGAGADITVTKRIPVGADSAAEAPMRHRCCSRSTGSGTFAFRGRA